jgi:hypothetical protein
MAGFEALVVLFPAPKTAAAKGVSPAYASFARPLQNSRPSATTEMLHKMTEKPVDLDQHRGMAAQKATDLRRLLTEVAANQQALRVTQDQLEAQLIAAPATTWEEVADKVRYLLSVFGATSSGQDPRRQTLINAVLDDFNRLSRK